MRQKTVAPALSRLLPALALLAIPSGTPPPGEAGLVGFSYGASGNSTPTGEKPESKLWWNHGSWWGSLYDDSSEEHRIFRLDAGSRSWVDTGTPLDDRGNAKADVLWDPVARKLYVASHVFSTFGMPTAASSQWARLYRYSYLAGAGSYSLDPDFPVAISRGVTEALTIAKDSRGRLWATWVESTRVMISHSLGADDLWSQPLVLPVDPTAVAVSSDDISAIVAFGSDRIGVMWSNQVAATTYFAVHHDGDAETLWQPEEIVVPDPSCSGPCSDDHISLKADSKGRVLAAIKTEHTEPGAPLVLITVRAPGGGWTSAVFGLVGDEHTRPILLLSETAGRIYVFASRPQKGGAIYFKDSPLDTPSFAPGVGQPFIQLSAYTRVNNATSTKQNLSVATDLIVLASDQEERVYLYNALHLGLGARVPVEKP